MTTDELGTCTYVAEKDDPSNWHGESPDDWMLDEDSWSCPHDVLEHEEVDDPEYCVFHTDPDDVPADVDAADRFVHAVNEESASDDEEVARRKKEFVGATFGEFVIEERTTIDAGDEFPIQFDHTTFRERLIVESVIVRQAGLLLRGTAFTGSDTSFQGTKIVGSVWLDHAEFTSSVRFDRVEFGGDARFDHAEFSGDIVWFGRFTDDASFREAEFSGDEIVSFGAFDDDVRFDRAKFSGDAKVEFGGVRFAGKASFANSKFSGDGDVSFTVAEFTGDALFLQTEFTGDGIVSFQDAAFTGDGDVAFAGAEFLSAENVDFEDAKFVGDARVSFQNAEFTADRHVSFRNATFTGTGDVSFRNVVFTGDVVFLGTEYNADADVLFDEAQFAGCNLIADSMSNVNLERADFTDVDLRDVDFIDSNLEGALLSRANLYGADFTGAMLDGAVFGNARVDQNTDFGDRVDYRVPYDRTNSGVSESGIERAGGVVRRHLPRRPPWDRASVGDADRVSDRTEVSNSLDGVKSDDGNRSEGVGDGDAARPDEKTDDRTASFRKAARAYHNLERIGRENSLPKLQTIGFVRRQEMHRLRYAEEAATAESGAWKLWAKWLRASVARATLLYGESPWRVIAVSLLAVLFCGALYPLGGFRTGDPNNPELIHAGSFGEWLSLLPDGIYFSTLTFTTLGFGDFQPAGWGRFLATGETALGATMIALLVFVLGRRAAR